MFVYPDRKMLCAVLIPTRKRFERLQKTIHSIRTTALRPERIRIVLRVDADDQEMATRRHELPDEVIVIKGERGRGYCGINLFYTEMANANQDCDWVWIMNDDCIIEGNSWDAELAQITERKVIVQPEIMGLGPSEYVRVEGGPFPIVRNGIWEELGRPVIDDPADLKLDELLRKGHGFQTRWLHGIKTQHNRDNDQELDGHRS